MDCNHDGQETWPEYDARGIYLCKVCAKCEKAKLAEFRPEVLTNPSYHADEPIEPEESIGGLDWDDGLGGLEWAD